MVRRWRRKKRVGVALSGGVDSTAAALILKDEGYEVVGLTMRIPAVVKPDREETLAVSSSRKIAEAIGIEHLIVDVSLEFTKKVIEPFLDNYASGLTPNPCVVCNRTMKFGLLLELALKSGCEFFATGHFARKKRNRRYRILKGIDREKDQSYVLWTLNQNTLGPLIFPLGDITKKEAETIVKNEGIFEMIHPESQDICFTAGLSHVEILRERIPHAFEPGPIFDLRGRTMGKHKGIPFYTVGQRKGIAVNNVGPFYVLEIKPGENAIVVGKESECETLGFLVEGVNLISGSREKEFECMVVTRYRGCPLSATVSIYKGNRARVTYHKPGTPASPGQSAVFYRGDELIGGGIIMSNFFAKAPDFIPIE